MPDFTFADFDPDHGPAATDRAALAVVPDAPADELTDLLTPDAPDETTAMLNIELLRRLARLRAQQAVYKDQAKALTPEIDKLNREVAEHIAEVTEADLRKGWQTTVDNATAYVKVSDYPKYLHPEGREKPYGMDDLIPALAAREDTKPLVKQTVNGNSWNAALRRMVEAWRERCDETGGPLNDDGEPVDAYGNVLTDAEREDPTADELALPPEIRALISVTTVVDVMFRQK